MLLFGKDAAEAIELEIREQVSNLPKESRPTLAVILVGSHAPSHTYVQNKKKACASVGIETRLHAFPHEVTEKELLECIQWLNGDSRVHGILLQLPLPSHLSSLKLIEAISPEKDVDGLHPLNMGKLLLGIPDGFVPCTPLGIQHLLIHYKIPIAGKHVVIVGRSSIVGKPLGALLSQNNSHGNATITIAHSRTIELARLTQSADILVAAVGIPRFITENMVSKEAVVIDVGINRVEDASHPKGYRLLGDVDFQGVEKKCSAITPVPRGIGPMTIAMLLHNTFLSFKRHVLKFK